MSDKYGVILADPPWQYANWTDSKQGAASSAIVVQDDDFIKNIPVKKWAAKDAILCLWCTWPKLMEGIEVAKAWGFEEYVTGLPWVKTNPSGRFRIGTGFWSLGVSEMVMIFRRGKPKRDRKAVKTVVGLLTDSVFYAPAKSRAHSSKPIGIHEWLEKPLKGPYLELFARDKREGWDCWGYDTGYELGEFGVRKHDRPLIGTEKTKEQHYHEVNQGELFE